jgi:hypothetical protein
MGKLGLILKIPLALLGVLSGVVLLLLLSVATVLYVPSLRQKALDKVVALANEKTDYDIDLGRLYLSPFHHSPKVLYRAYKGEDDLPLQVEIDSLFIGHRGQDTLVYSRVLRLRAELKTANRTSPFSDITALPIVVDELRLETTTFHSDSMIGAVGIDAIVNRLSLTSPEILLAEGKYPLHGLRLNDAYVGIDLRDTPPDTTAQDTTPLLMAFDVPDGEMRNVHFRLTPLGMDIRTRYLSTNVLADVGGSLYDAKRLNVHDFAFDLGSLHLPFDTIYGNACVDLEKQLITSRGLHARSSEIGATADLYTTEMNLETMSVNVAGDADYKGSKARLRAFYDIDSETYDAAVHIERVNLSPFLKDSTRVILAGDLEAKGKGINPHRPMTSRVKLRLDEAIYGPYNFSHTTFEGSTDSVTALALSMPSLQADVQSPMPLFTLLDRLQPLLNAIGDSTIMQAITSLTDLTILDTIRPLIPALQADIQLRKGSSIQSIIDSTGIDLNTALLTLRSDEQRTDIALDATTNDQSQATNKKTLRLPAAKASLNVGMTEGQTDVSLTADTHLKDGAMNIHDLRTDAALRLDLTRQGKDLRGDGRLTLDDIYYGDRALGNHAVDLRIAPSQGYANALRADVQTEDIPLDLVESFVTLPDIALRGAVRAAASVDGLPNETDMSAEVVPLSVAAEYKPYQVGLSLGQTPIIMSHNHVDLNGLPVYGADSTYLTLSGGLDLNSMRMDVTLAADSFAPVKLVKDGPIPVYGDLATDIRGSVTGPLDSIVADVDVTILPTTDITYPIDKKNLAQVKPHGTVNVKFQTAEAEPLSLAGRIHVDDGTIRYSPKAYPIMPFRVDSGSRVAFRGPVGKTRIQVSASQQVKADVESEGEETRRVDFTTGVRVNGELDSLGLQSIGFFLEAPDDEQITRELASLDEDTREGLAATLLATGMYVGESNVAAQRDGYALSSIVNSRINAAMANSKAGKVVDIDISSGQSTHAAGKTNDMNISISKSFFNDKLRITLGSTLTDNPEVNETNGLFTNLTADYKLTKEGNVLLRLFSQRDYNNILEGELYKSGIGVRATKDWRRKELFRGDSISRTYGLTADAGVAYRSNNSIGPDLTLKSTIKNVLGKGEQFTLKGNGAYYWALRDRHPGDPKKTDTYKLGLNASLVFPYLHWTGDNNPKGDTRYMLGYQYENIAGGYGVHKLSGSFTYFIHSPNSPYITHAFTPFSLSVVMMKAEATDLLNKAAEYPQLIKVLAGDEFVPSISYNFIYDDYRAKRPVNTFLNLGVKESGNLINAIYCLAGHKWNEQEKKLGKITFNQFVKLSAELRNKYNFTDKVCIATRLFAGANIPLGNSFFCPLSEAFYVGGPNSLRASSPYAYGPGNFYSAKYNQNFFHAGDFKLEANFELRFPIVWKLYGAAFVDAGNVWNWYSMVDLFKEAGYEDYLTRLEIPETLRDGIINNPDFGKQIALGTGAGLRLDIDGLVVRFDLGVGIHVPYQTFRYDKEGNPDLTKPITTYFNLPSALDALRFNFGIGYPF